MAKNRLSRLKGIVTGTKTDAEGEHPQLASEVTRLEHFTHFWVLVVRSFVRNRCLVRASALSFSSLLALIPMLAVAISVTSSLLKSQGEDQIYEAINKFVSSVVPPATVSTNTPPAPASLKSAVIAAISTNTTILPTNAIAELTATNSIAETNAATAEDDARVVTAQKEAARSIHEFVQNTRSGTLGLVSMLLLVYVAISMLANIEATFNDIWGVARGRNWLWRIVLYWATLTLGPLALVGASSLAGSSHFELVRHMIRSTVVGGVIFEILPLLILWLVFALVYMTVPNIKVRFRSALVGGIVAGSLWQLNNLFGYLYVSRVITNSKIYGSLGLVPVFMAGLYFSWAILLFGAQVSYAFQNRKAYLEEKFAENVNQRGREFIALRLMTFLGLRYQNGEPPPAAPQIAEELGISTRLTEQIIETLLTGRLIMEVSGSEAAYCPARPLDVINAHQVLLAVRSVTKAEVFTRDEPVRDEIYGEFARIEEAERIAAAAVTLEALVNRARATLEAPALTRSEPPLALEDATPPPAAEPIHVADLTVEPPAETAPATPPPKAVRKIFAPEENHDFPL